MDCSARTHLMHLEWDMLATRLQLHDPFGDARHWAVHTEGIPTPVPPCKRTARPMSRSVHATLDQVRRGATRLRRLMVEEPGG